MVEAVRDFTLDPLEWAPYVHPIELETATPEQREALRTTPSNTKVSAYVLTLAHDPESLAERTPLFNDIMYASGGLSRAERELGALAASVVNHCIYCARVHAARYIELSKRREVVEAIFRGETNGALSPREQAIFDVAVRLTREPAKVGAEERQRLREHGLTDLEILDLVHAVAIFGWANRLMHTLGEARRRDPNAVV